MSKQRGMTAENFIRWLSSCRVWAQKAGMPLSQIVTGHSIRKHQKAFDPHRMTSRERRHWRRWITLQINQWVPRDTEEQDAKR